MDPSIQYLSDFHLCQECMEGSSKAIETLRSRSASLAAAFLVNAGATSEIAAETVDCLWTHLLAPREGKAPRIALYDGSCAFQTWLNSVALNQFISRQRADARWQNLIAARLGSGADDESKLPPGAMVDPASFEPDNSLLVDLMRDAVEYSFRSCDAEDFVLLHLRHSQGLRTKELARMFGCASSGITRRLDKAEAHIAAATILRIRQRDPWLELRWEDFVELCRTATPACFGLE